MNHSAICTHLQHLQSLARGTGLRARLIRGAMGVGAVKILSLSLTFASSIVLARALGPERFGQYTFIMSVIMVLSMLLDQGMRQLITREVASYKHGEHWELLRGIFRRTQQWYFMGLLLVVIILGSVAISKTTWSMDDYWTLLLIGLIILPFFWTEWTSWGHTSRTQLCRSGPAPGNVGHASLPFDTYCLFAFTWIS
jgi:hypothetical protein